MRGLKSDDLKAIVDFLYFGEANIYQDGLDSFLALAEELQLKGLEGSKDQQESNEPEQLKPDQKFKTASSILPSERTLQTDIQGVRTIVDNAIA